MNRQFWIGLTGLAVIAGGVAGLVYVVLGMPV